MTRAYKVHPTPASEAAGQRAAYAVLLQALGQASIEEIKAALEEREDVSPEAELQYAMMKIPTPGLNRGHE